LNGHKRSGGGRGRGRAEASNKTAKADPNITPLRPVEEPPNVEAFTEWELGTVVQEAIAAMEITKPTPIQALAIGPVLEGRDVIAKAETGTGKTLAFGAPMMAKIDPSRRTVLGLVLSPTRELAEQVHNVLQELGIAAGIKTALVVGGEPLAPQVRALQNGAQVVVGTPGRVMDLMGQGFLTFPWTEFVVLDEADKMLEIGFLEDIEKILAQVNEDRQTLLFSATFPPSLLKLARGQTKTPVEIATATGIATVTTIRQCCIETNEDDRANLLQKIVRGSNPEDAFLVFCDRRTDVDRLMRRMERERYGVRALHGGYDQAARFRVMTAFRAKEVKVLLATDVASRGLDVKHISHVINFAAPRDHADYTHRIGRTGRAGRMGTAITFVTPPTRRYWSELLSITKFDVELLKGPRDLFDPKSKRAPQDAEKSDSNEARDDRPSKPRERTSPREERSSEDRPRRRRERNDAPREESSSEDRPRRRRERSDAPREERSSEDRPRRQRERSDAPREERSSEDRPRRQRERNDAPREERASEDRPRRRPERDDGPRERQPRREQRDSEAPRREKRERKPREQAPSSSRAAEDAPRAKREDSPQRKSGGEGAKSRNTKRYNPKQESNGSGFGAGL
jgi:superfamily II DNA/RNA helicase